MNPTFESKDGLREASFGRLLVGLEQARYDLAPQFFTRPNKDFWFAAPISARKRLELSGSAA